MGSIVRYFRRFKFILFIGICLTSSCAYAKEYARRYPTDTALSVVTPGDPLTYSYANNGSSYVTKDYMTFYESITGFIQGKITVGHTPAATDFFGFTFYGLDDISGLTSPDSSGALAAISGYGDFMSSGDIYSGYGITIADNVGNQFFNTVCIGIPGAITSNLDIAYLYVRYNATDVNNQPVTNAFQVTDVNGVPIFNIDPNGIVTVPQSIQKDATHAPTSITAAATDNSTQLSTTAFVTTAINNAIAGVNPAVAVQAATTQASDTSGLAYNNGASGIGATLTGTNNTALTIDGYTFTAVNQRLLVKNDTQSPSGARNGVYYLTQIQTAILPPILTRALDYNMPSDINNTGAIPVINGTVNASTSWVITSTVNTVGTDALTYTQFSINPTNIAQTNAANTFNLTQTFSGGMSFAYKAVASGTYTITSTDFFIDCTPSAVTTILPSAVGISGRYYIIKNSSATASDIVQAATGQTVDGATSTSLRNQYETVGVISDNSNWKMVFGGGGGV